MIYIGQDWGMMRCELARLGVTITEDDHLITLSCGEEEQTFSALGVDRQTLIHAAKEMAYRVDQEKAWKGREA